MVGPPSLSVSADRDTRMPTTSPSEAKPVASAPPGAWAPLVRVAEAARRPLERFLRIEASSGILLMLAAAAALAWANSPWAWTYHHLWQTPLGINVGVFRFERPLEWIVNDGLMAIFFFVVGLEIRREIHAGELSDVRRATLPFAAAMGGMVAPALIYLCVTPSGEASSGWGVPMATDIAFAIGILTLLGRRVPPALRVLLLALAVIDDLGAVVAIAMFYSSGITLAGLLAAALGLAGILAMQRFGVRAKLAYVPPSLVVWAGVYGAGVHPTIAGVIIGLVTPVRAWLGAEGFIHDTREKLDELSDASPQSLSRQELGEALQHVNLARREAMSPAESLIASLHPWVAFAIMPIFALANAGVKLSGDVLEGSSSRVAFAVVLGLLFGKPLGVLATTWGALKLGLCALPRGLGGRHLAVLGVVAGVGFTMALFIAQLAFEEPRLLAAAKMGVLGASGTAAVVALVLGRALLPRDPTHGAARTADAAEQSTVV